MQGAQSTQRQGLFFALGAFAIWGLLPLYIHALRWVPPFELVGWRIVFTVPVCLLVLLATRRMASLRLAIGNPRVLAVLAASALLIAANWVIYAYAVQSGQVLAASLGYYINPLVNVLGGTLVFGERLSRAKWIAVGVATLGVSLLAWDARDMLWISVSLALTFGGYGIVRKLAPVDALPGLTVESILLLGPALVALALPAMGPQGSSMGRGLAPDLLLASAGVLTATPLLLFTMAARRLDLSLLGFIQFSSPTLQFVLGVTYFGEALRPVQLACFALIWVAVALFCLDLWRSRRRPAPVAIP